MNYLETLIKGGRVVADDQKVCDEVTALESQLNERGLVLECAVKAMSFGEIQSVEYKATKHHDFVKTHLFDHVRKAYEMVQMHGMTLWQAADKMGLENAWEVSHMLRRAKVALGERAFDMGKPAAKPCPKCNGTGEVVETNGFSPNHPDYDYEESTCERCGGDGVLPEAEA